MSTYENVVLNRDGSYTFVKNGLPYNCPDEGEWAEEYARVHAYAKTHPDEVTIEPEPEPPTLEEFKAAKRQELLAARDAAIRDGTTWQGHPIWTDGDAQRLALSVMAAPTLAAAVGSPETVPYPTWTCKDGHVVQLDEAYATDLCLTIQTYVTAMYNVAAGLLTQVAAAQSAEDVAAIVWPEDLDG